MSEPIGEHNIREYLTAFADGELEAADILSVLAYISAHPEAVGMIRDQQRLRLAAHRVIRGQTPAAPDALRERVAALARATAGPGAPMTAPLTAPVPGGAGRTAWWTAAAAAVSFLLIGLAAGRALRPAPVVRTVVQTVQVEPPTPVIAATVVAQASRIHADCSRVADALHAAPFPAGELRECVAKDLLGPHPYPDLTGIGFRYLGAGPCEHPLENTIHLLYRGNAKGTASVSVFVQMYAGQFDLQPDKLYLASGPASPFPMLVWRTERVIYFLLADDPDTVERARRAIATAPRR